MPGEQNPLIDKAIDDTARELTEGRPHAALRTNVAAQIAGHQSSPWRLGWVAGSAVAAVVIVAVLMWPARVEDIDNPRNMPVGRALSGSPGEPERVHPTNEAVPSEIVAEPPSATEQLAVESLEVAALGVDELEVPTLTVEAMTVEPLPLQ